MELYKIVSIKEKSAICILKITGNSRFRILNDFENYKIKRRYISISFDSIFLEVENPNINKYYINILQNPNKEFLFYMKFIYNYGKRPVINCIWDYNGFTPYNVIYPINTISYETYKKFNISMKIDLNEFHKNDNIIYEGTNNKHNKIQAPQVISKYGKLLNIETQINYDDDQISNDYFGINDKSDSSDIDEKTNEDVPSECDEYE
jgi:hypothetical protein